MARIIENFPNTVTPDSDYPYGRIRDNDGTGNGTPVNEFTNGDIHQFFARMMDQAGISPNGLPDSDYATYQLFLALIQNIRNTAATESLKGTAEIATQTETNIGTDDQRFVTPLKLLENRKSRILYRDSAGVETLINYAEKIVEIGDWNMNSSASGTNAITITNVIAVSGIVDEHRIITVQAFIRRDDDATFRTLESGGGSSSNQITGSSGGSVGLTAPTGGSFDNALFDSTGFNRGWLYVKYRD